MGGKIPEPPPEQGGGQKIGTSKLDKLASALDIKDKGQKQK